MSQIVTYLPHVVSAKVIQSFGGISAGSTVSINRVPEGSPDFMVGIQDSGVLPGAVIDHFSREEVIDQRAKVVNLTGAYRQRSNV